MSGLYDCRDAFANTLRELAAADPRVVVVVNDSVGSSKVGGFRQQYPQRTINVGIAEQNMISVAAGQKIDAEYRVDSISASSIRFTYLPLKTLQSLELSEAGG